MSKKDTVQFKEGDRVLVSDDGNDWHERIFLVTMPGNCKAKYITVNSAFEKEYERGESYDFTRWRHIKPLEETTLDGKTVEIDGKEYLLTIKN